MNSKVNGAREAISDTEEEDYGHCKMTRKSEMLNVDNFDDEY
jgi:hypothetical protein